jgi:starch phosphorylase
MDFSLLYDQYLQPEWRDRFSEPEIWDQVDDIPDEELFEAHRRRKRRLVGFVRARQVQSAIRRQAPASEIRRAGEVLDPNAFTIGFARRFATYKRATLIFRDVARLKKILCNPDLPVQIIITGKAHPKDSPGKTLIREIVQYSRDPELWKHVVFLEDYDMKVAREMVQGVDLWLNNPRRGEEACGTSGMKAGINGVLNLSILDGWWDEAADFTGGWTIGDHEPYSEDQDPLHASAIYYLLENEIVPLFYENRDHTPREWVKRVKKSLKYLSYHFDARRMISEYMSELYHPAHLSYTRLREGKFQEVRDRVRWNAKVREVWGAVRFVEMGPGPIGTITSGKPVPVRAAVELAGLKAEDVRVEVVVGRVGIDGGLEDTEVMVLPPTEQNGTVAVFAKDIVPERTGRLGYALRISPDHWEDPLTRPCTNLLKWGTTS